MALGTSPLDWWESGYLYNVFMFGALWIFSYLKFSEKPSFLRRASLVIPFFIIAHLIAGKIGEARLMLPLAFIVIPMSFFYLFRANRQMEPDAET
jgi:hypothetical protein